MSRPGAARRKAAFIKELRDYRERCGKPRYKQIAALSESVSLRYPPRAAGCPPGEGAETHLVTLSLTAISEVLGGVTRKGLPTWPWTASFVLCCTWWGYKHDFIDVDPGRDVLRVWAHRYWLANRATERTIPLPSRVRAFLASHGPYGEVLAQDAEVGDSEAIFRAAILLATDPAHTEEALALLLWDPASEHAATSDLANSSPDVLEPRIAARYARALAKAASSQEEAIAFNQAAARGDAAHRDPHPAAPPAADSNPVGVALPSGRQIPQPRPGTDPTPYVAGK